MAILRPFGWSGWDWREPSEFDRVRREMNRLFRNLEGVAGEPRAGVFPLTNFSEDSDNYYVRAELPGMKNEDIDISLTGESLTLSGERKIPVENAKYHRREREAGKFSRVLGLPGPVDVEKADASFADGILTVILPKAEAAKPRQISVATK